MRYRKPSEALSVLARMVRQARAYDRRQRRRRDFAPAPDRLRIGTPLNGHENPLSVVGSTAFGAGVRSTVVAVILLLPSLAWGAVPDTVQVHFDRIFSLLAREAILRYDRSDTTRYVAPSLDTLRVLGVDTIYVGREWRWREWRWRDLLPPRQPFYREFGEEP